MDKLSSNTIKKSKRILAFVFTLVILCVPFSSIATAAEGSVLQKVENPTSKILNAPTNIAIIDSLETLQGLQEGKPSNAMMYTDASLNVNTKDGANITTVETALASLGNNIIPAFYVKDKDTVDKLTTYLNDKKIVDVLIISADSDVAKYSRQKNQIFRNAVDFSSVASEEATDAKLLEIRGITTTANSLIAILPVKYAVTKNVSYLQSLGVSVWIINDNLAGNTEIAKMITSGATGLITNNYKRINESFNTLFVDNTLTKTPIIIGHRGNPTNAPENSLSSYLIAVQNGADVVETDVYLTKDNKIVIMHDPKLNTTTNYKGTALIEQMTLEEIKKYNLWDAGDKFKSKFPDEKVPTLDEMMDALKDKDCKIFLEIKSTNVKIVQFIADMIKERGYEDRVFVICFTAAQLTALQKVMPTMGTGLLTSVTAYSPAQMHEMLYKDFLRYHACNSTFNPSFANLSDNYISALRDRGITCWPWTYSTIKFKEFNDAFIWGIDGITTNDAQYSKDMVKKLNTSASDITLKPGETSNITAEKVTYGRVNTNIIGDENTFVYYLEGEDVINLENGTVTALKDGTSTFMLGHKTKTKNNTEYVLYTQPFVVTVGSAEVSEVNEFPTKIVAISASALVVLLTGVFVFVNIKKKKV